MDAVFLTLSYSCTSSTTKTYPSRRLFVQLSSWGIQLFWGNTHLSTVSLYPDSTTAEVIFWHISVELPTLCHFPRRQSCDSWMFLTCSRKTQPARIGDLASRH